MDLIRHLRFFTAVADARHFGNAARDLGMTQPPLSQGIQRLELHLGVRLFDRDARSVRLTEPGHKLLSSARELIRTSDDLVDLAKGLAIPEQLRLGVPGDLEEIAHSVLRRLSEQGLPVAPTVAGSVEIIDLVRDGVLDMGVVRHPGVIDGLEAGPVIVVATRLESLAHPGADREDLSDITLPIAVPPRHHQPPSHDQLIDDLRRAGHSGQVVEAADVTQRRALVSSGLAARIVPTLDRPGSEQCPPLRVRIVMPRGSLRRSEVQYEAFASALSEALHP